MGSPAAPHKKPVKLDQYIGDQRSAQGRISHQKEDHGCLHIRIFEHGKSAHGKDVP